MTMIGLVSCSSLKMGGAARARDFYASPLFRASLAYAESHCERTYVLSAKHGLVGLDDEIEPYNLALTQLRAFERVIWAHRVAIQLVAREGADRSLRVMFLAGREYVDPIIAAIRPLRWITVDPMHGMQIGERLSWLARYASTSGSTVTTKG